MAKFVQLETAVKGKKIFINPEHVQNFYAGSEPNETYLCMMPSFEEEVPEEFQDGSPPPPPMPVPFCVTVKGTPEEIAEKLSS